MKYIKTFSIIHINEKYNYYGPYEHNYKDNEISYLFLSDKTNKKYKIVFRGIKPNELCDEFPSIRSRIITNAINNYEFNVHGYMVRNMYPAYDDVNTNINDAISLTLTQANVIKDFINKYTPDMIFLQHIESDKEGYIDMENNVTKRAKLFRRYIGEIPYYHLIEKGSLTFIIKYGIEFKITD